MGELDSPNMLGRTVSSVRVADLQPHPQNRHFFGVTSEADDAALREDIARQGLRTHVIVCGSGCAHDAGTILAGHRRVEALRALGITEAVAIVIDGLDRDAALDVLLGDNLAASRARILSHSQRYRIEEAQREILARRAGQRSDLSGGDKGETATLIAKKTGEPANAVRNRQKVFGSTASPPELQAAVDDGKVSLTAGAKVVRKLEGLTEAERKWKDVASSVTELRTKVSKKPSTTKDAAAQTVTTPAVPPLPESADLRERFRSALLDFDLFQQRVLEGVAVVLGSFPPVPSAGSGSPLSQDAWSAQVDERWLPLIAMTGALHEHGTIVGDLIAHAIGALEASDDWKAHAPVSKPQ